MFRDRYDDDYPHLRKPEHIEKVWKAIKAGYEKYLPEILEPKDPIGLSGLEALGRVVKARPSPSQDVSALNDAFKKALKEFEKDAPQYVQFFDAEFMDEFADQPGSFKGELMKGVPVIRYTVHSQQTELLEWRKRFNTTKSPLLFEMFTNLAEFYDQYVDRVDPKEFGKFNQLEDFDFEDVEDDEECRIDGVIGMGIKAAVLHHLCPEMFPPRDRYSLLGLFLLSDCDPFRLPSGSSEFVMYSEDSQLDDGTNKPSHNFWYPYSNFTLYSLRIYRELKRDLKELGVKLDDHYRFIYTAQFLQEVCAIERPKIRTFLAHDVPRGKRDYV